MTKYREILRLSSLGLSQQNIADNCNVSKKTVNRVLRRAKELDISWPLDESDTDAVLAEKFFPSANQITSNKRMPDYAFYIDIYSFFCLLGKKDRTYNSVNDPEILEIRYDNSIEKRGAYETDYFSRENENFSFMQ